MFKKLFKKTNETTETAKTETGYNGYDSYVEYIANTYGDGDVAFYESCFLY